MDKHMWATHTVEYYSVTKKSEVLTDAVTWTNLEDVIRIERSQMDKNV